MGKVEKGQTVSLHYIGTLDDGTEFDSSRSREEPMTCEVGAGQLISGFDNALVGMAIGETKKISLSPNEAYGNILEEAIQVIPKTSFPEDFQFNVGEFVQGQGESGNIVSAKIEALENDNVTLDFNHPMAGKNLNFEIELLKIQ